MRGSSHYRNNGYDQHQTNKVTHIQIVSVELIIRGLYKNWSFPYTQTIAKRYNILKHNNLNYCTAKIRKDFNL